MKDGEMESVGLWFLFAANGLQDVESMLSVMNLKKNLY